MTVLSVSDYDTAEHNAAKTTCNRALSAFTPVLFDKFNYPSRIKSISELWRFVDVMQEQRALQYIEHILKGLSESEFQLFQLLTSSVSEFSEKRFGRKEGAWSAILQSLSVYRHLSFFCGASKLRILEIGPGCGYLGALLTLAGHAYAATDVTQALYLYQNLVWAHLFPQKLHETATTELGNFALQSLLDTSKGTGVCIHLPWWHYANLYKGPLPTVDIVTCNNAFAEMQHDSLAYSLSLARHMLAHSSGPGLLLCEGFGWNASLPFVYVVEQVYKHGFVIAHRDPAFMVLALREACAEGRYQTLENAVTKGDLTWGNNIYYWAEQLHDFAGGENPISTHVLRSRQNHLATQSISPGEVISYYQTVMGTQNPMTEDERFWEFVQHPKQ